MMPQQKSNTSWQRPKGVSQGNWQYICNRAIAAHYDQSLEDSPLVTLDQIIIERHLPSTPGLAIDFGCGTGRNAIPIAQLNWRVLGVDLSIPMLESFQSKIKSDPNRGILEDKVTLIQANLLELDGLGSHIADFGQCMFSTFGMIQGRQYRKQFLKHVHRILKPDAVLIIHAHNYWYNLRHHGGWKWMLGNLFSSVAGKSELGERSADYRSISRMTLHHFSSKSFRQAVAQSGFHIEKLYAIHEDGSANPQSGSKIGLNTVGWILIAKTGSER